MGTQGEWGTHLDEGSLIGNQNSNGMKKVSEWVCGLGLVSMPKWIGGHLYGREGG